MSDEIARRRQQRTGFVTRLYWTVDGSVNEFVSAFEIGSEIGLGDADVARVLGYLEEKGFIKVDDHKLGIVRITAAGVDFVEAAESE